MRRASWLAVLGLAAIVCVSVADAGDAKPARFTKTGCGAIFDTRTGLAWYVGSDEPADAHEARSFVEKLSACGGNWRMPMMKELEAESGSVAVIEAESGSAAVARSRRSRVRWRWR